jgi:hypothetical protein
MAETAEAPMRRWAAALDAARRAEGVAQVVWVGDSISELNRDALPLPWQIGNLLAGRTEPVQYRNASADLYSPGMRTDGASLEGADAGLGGRGVELAPGQATAYDADGEGVSILWIRRPGGGQLAVRWGEDRLGTVTTDGAHPGAAVTTLTRRDGRGPAEIEITASGAPVRVAGVYVHDRNLRTGVRVWPAVRAGNKSRWFSEHPNWVVEPLAALRPDLVVLATGTNDDDYELEISGLIRTVRAHAHQADVALWLPPLNGAYTVDRAVIGREVARREGCGLIDAAGDLGALPTTDGVHPTPFTVAMSSGHAAAVLGGPATGAWWSALVESNQLLADGQRWGRGGGVIDVDLPLGLATLSGRARAGDAGAAWVLALPPLAKAAAGVDGAVLGLGPGGSEHPDTFLSRSEPGRLAVNGGRGALELERVVIRVHGAAEGSEELVTLLASRTGDGDTEVVAETPGGTRRLVATPPGLDVPLPCALRAHGHPTVPFAPAPDQVIWVPMPAVARRALATRVWLEVLEPVAGAVATAGVVDRGGPGRPGDLLGRTGLGAIDCASAGVVGAALLEPVPLEPGVSWWVGVHIVGGASDGLVLGGAWSLRGGAGAEPIAPEATPSVEAVSGALVSAGSDGLPPSAPRGAAALLGPAPALHVSLDAPPPDRAGGTGPGPGPDGRSGPDVDRLDHP